MKSLFEGFLGRGVGRLWSCGGDWGGDWGGGWKVGGYERFGKREDGIVGRWREFGG